MNTINNNYNYNLDPLPTVTEDNHNNLYIAKSSSLEVAHSPLAVKNIQLKRDGSIIMSAGMFIKMLNKDKNIREHICPIIVEGDLTIKNYSIDRLHSNKLTIKGNLCIESCPDLLKITSDQLIVNKIEIKNCNNIRKIADKSNIQELTIKKCNKLILSQNDTVKKRFHISYCDNIPSLPSLSHNVDSATIIRCENIHITNNINIKGNFSFIWCEDIYLYKEIKVGRDVSMDHCNNFVNANIIAKKDINITHCKFNS